MAAKPGKITRLVITVNLGTGKIDKVVGMDDADIDKAIAEKSAVAENLDRYKTTLDVAYNKFWEKEPRFVGSIFWTRSSPGCGWVLQDGWYQWICDH
jgi:hypothetical protein